MRCDLCPAEAIAFLPGSEAVARVGIVVCRGEKRRAWCLACWPWLQRADAAEATA